MARSSAFGRRAKAATAAAVALQLCDARQHIQTELSALRFTETHPLKWKKRRARTAFLKGVAGDGGAAAAVQGGEEGALTHNRQAGVLVVEAGQVLRRRIVALPARDANCALHQTSKDAVCKDIARTEMKWAHCPLAHSSLFL